MHAVPGYLVPDITLLVTCSGMILGYCLATKLTTSNSLHVSACAYNLSLEQRYEIKFTVIILPTHLTQEIDHCIACSGFVASCNLDLAESS